MRQSLIIILVIWTVLYLMGYPGPMSDDLYFSGTAINLAQGSGYSNPYCNFLAAWGAGDNFFVYVPLHAYTLAAWIKVFGISRWSFDLFQCLAGMAASLFLIELFACKRSKLFGAVILSLFVAFILCSSGLRPDALGLALFLGGSLILRARSILAWTLCSFSLFLTAICSPNFVTLGLVVVLSALYFRSASIYPLKKETLGYLAATACAGLAAFVVFLLMIHFELGLFLRIFRDFSRNNQHAWYLAFKVKESTVLLHVICLTTVTFSALFAAYLKPKLLDVPVTRGHIVAFTAGLASVLLTYFSSVKGSLWLDTYFFLTLLWLALHLTGSTLRIQGLAGLIVLAFFIHRGTRVLQLAILSFSSAHLHQPEWQAQIEALHPAQIYIDPFAFAAIYDYRIPANALDINLIFRGKSSQVYSFPPNKFLPNSLLVMSPVYIESERAALVPFLPNKTHPKWTANPYEFILIRAP